MKTDDPAMELQQIVCALAQVVSRRAKMSNVSCMIMLPDGCYKEGRKHDLHVTSDGKVFVTVWLRNGASISEVMIEDCTKPPEPRPGQERDDARYSRKILLALAEALPLALDSLATRKAERDASTREAIETARKKLRQ